MAIYEEKTYSWWKGGLIVAVAFLIMYAPWKLGERELYWEESDYASMAKEMVYFPPLTVIHGQMIPAEFPMFSSIASFFFNIGVPMELAVRCISVFSLAILAFIVWEAARTAAGLQASFVASAVMISSIIVLEKSIDGYPETLGLLFVVAAWLAWFNLGAGSGRWSLAWIVSFFFCGVGFYTIGWPAIIYFLFPLIFMRRPLTVWQKLKKPGFWLGVMILVGFILFWGLPRWIGGEGLHFRDLAIPESEFDVYLTHLYRFPVEVLLRYLPWSILGWAPFCVAFHPLDKTPIFSRFLRTVFISLFFLLWFSPFTDPRDLIILAPPLAIMTGINYWLLVRRYGFQLHKVIELGAYGLIGLSAFVAILFVLPVGAWKLFGELEKYQGVFQNYALEGFLYSVSALLIGVGLVMFEKHKQTVILRMLLICVAGSLLMWSVIHPLKVEAKYSEGSKSNFGVNIRNAIGHDFNPEITIYKNKVKGLYGGCFYIGCNIKQIQSFDELPDEEVVYLISMEYPIYPARLWTEIKSAKYKKSVLKLYKGEKVKKGTNAASKKGA